MEPRMQFVKYLLFVFNLVFVITGITLIITGAVIQSMYSTYLDFIGNKYLTAPILFIVVGVVILVVAFFGCCGAIKESSPMMLTFAVLLGIIFVIEVAAGVAAYTMRRDVARIVDENMATSLQYYNATDHEGVTKTWDVLQHDLQCCGALNYTDWFKTPFGQYSDSVPDSCCRVYSPGCGHNVGGNSPGLLLHIWTKGCARELADQVVYKSEVFTGVGIGIAVIQLLGILFACMLAASIRRSYSMV